MFAVLVSPPFFSEMQGQVFVTCSIMSLADGLRVNQQLRARKYVLLIKLPH